MKKLLAAVLLIALILAGCGKEAPVTLKPDEVYTKMMALDGMPEMIAIPADKAYLMFGINPEDCVYEQTLICDDSLQADELWVVEAKDSDAAARIAGLAKNRLEQKATELKDYLPEQYAVVQQAKVIEQGNCVILIVSPLVEDLAKLAA